ncbi:phosphoenolpyruvate--protein phosphotransferase [Halothermothrix orenii]|uniref:Phosphoenolpyruvate-protein phosphotransferase n=1 Tax=Halothermothrix orenii (strain H 168 / OCM 544 / DSM 9562) TaxID=373903 RepID=B8CY25_HALOH|nr:phosphoenolpyruvate--protein phosphotransferase [Halothermothrix orenii]ACL70194.1 phosphoenolpyruvate-protein phosphotransferase [Halothermothrix orenii H 168]
MNGIGASPGIAIGKVYIKNSSGFNITEKNIDEHEVQGEIERLNDALEKAKKEVTKLEHKVRKELGEDEADIFRAHLQLLNDPELIPEIENEIKNNLVTAETAVQEVINHYVRLFSRMENEYMKGRKLDIQDVGTRVLQILVNYKKDHLNKDIGNESIIVARDLAPSDTVNINLDRVMAFVTAEGSKTSHTAIIARSLGIPAVVGVGEELLKKVHNGQMIVVDGNSGKVYLNPDKATLDKYKMKLNRLARDKKRLNKYKFKKPVTRDGVTVEVFANISSPEEVGAVIDNGGQGVGLFRTEFMYMHRDSLPDEEEQYNLYLEIAKKMDRKPVIIRTLDIGGDKDLPYLNLPEEMNPFLGYRGIRICLDKKDLFKTQLKAILRAGKHGNVRLMFPLISSLEELKKAYHVLEESKQELEAEGKEYVKDMETGLMIEVPAAALMADILAQEVDFFSIGTNDLIQYMMAVDRTNEQVASIYSPYYPAVLRMIYNVIKAAHRESIKVGMCGEAAGDELLIPFLLGAGLDEFSVNIPAILNIKEKIARWTISEAREVVKNTLKLKTAGEVKDYLSEVKKD